jgi:hypothetical protein
MPGAKPGFFLRDMLQHAPLIFNDFRLVSARPRNIDAT